MSLLQVYEQGTATAVQVEGQKASDKFYWDAKWTSATGQLTLYAASAAGTLDVYSASF